MNPDKRIRQRFGKFGLEHPIKVAYVTAQGWVAWFGPNPEIGPAGYGASAEDALTDLQSGEEIYQYISGSYYQRECSACGHIEEFREFLPAKTHDAGWGLHCSNCDSVIIFGICEDEFMDTEEEDSEEEEPPNSSKA
jgi:hypothetical protein